MPVVIGSSDVDSNDIPKSESRGDPQPKKTTSLHQPAATSYGAFASQHSFSQ